MDTELHLKNCTGQCLKTAAAVLGVKLRSNCGGAGTCKKCKVVLDGKEVLACQTTVTQDCTVNIPAASIQPDENQTVIWTSAERIDSTEAKFRSSIETGYGVAVDIGTTTLAAELHPFGTDHRFPFVACRINPQRQFGDDVLSRIQAVMTDADHLPKLQQLVVAAINEMLTELAGKAGIAVSEITSITAAGNTVMELLLHGFDPVPLGQVPFQPPVSEFLPRRAAEIGLNIATDGLLETLPIFGGFVGGDIVADVLSVRAGKSALPSNVFLIDIGTNGELVLFDDDKIYTAATAAGPAFEGARIEYGTLAIPGAIDRVFSTGTEEHPVAVTTIANRPAVGICGSGLIDAAAVLLDLGIIQSNGKLSGNGIPADKNAKFELVPAEQSGIDKAIYLTQRDIRQLQLAAGAIRAGIRLLIEQAGLNAADLEAFYIAGSFGQFIDKRSAQRIGLIPREIPLERVYTVGNTSLAGARLLLLDPQYTELTRQFIAQSESVELARLPRFSEVFAESMSF